MDRRGRPKPNRVLVFWLEGRRRREEGARSKAMEGDRRDHHLDYCCHVLQRRRQASDHRQAVEEGGFGRLEEEEKAPAWCILEVAAVVLLLSVLLLSVLLLRRVFRRRGKEESRQWRYCPDSGRRRRPSLRLRFPRRWVVVLGEGLEWIVAPPAAARRR
jgi:hypothetical protein